MPVSKLKTLNLSPSANGELCTKPTKNSNRGIAMIDTEHGSGDLYSDMLEYDILQLSPPFECQKYLDAIKEAEKENYEVIIVDSLSHAWAGEGGLLDLHTKIANTGKENSYTAWRQVTPLHNALIEAMLQSECHIIATARSKMEYTIEKDNNGRSTIKKVGLQPVFRDGIEFEFTLFLDLAQDHTAFATKDRTTLFDGKYFKITRETGETILAWLNSNNHKPTLETNRETVPSDEQSKATKTRNSKPVLDSNRGNSNSEFLKCVEKMKGQVDPDTFKEICKPYEPLDKLHDRVKQVELYNKLKENELFALT